MKMYLLGLAALAALVMNPAIRAEDKAETALKCPVSGKPATKDHAVSYDGGKVYFCCDNCPKAFEKDPSKFAAKAHHQMAETGQLVEAKCPLTGNPLNAEKTIDCDGVKVAFCCGNCLKKAQAMSADELLAKIFTDVSKSYKLADSKDSK